jgi:hypothetical protein
MSVTGRYIHAVVRQLQEAVERLTSRPESGDLTVRAVLQLVREAKQRPAASDAASGRGQAGCAGR